MPQCTRSYFTLFALAFLCLISTFVWGQQKDVAAKQAVVVAVSPPAVDVGVDVLKKGGNAVDAAVAVALAMAVTWPEAGNIGGGGFMMVLPEKGKEPVCVEYRETAPAAAKADMFTLSEKPYSAKYVGTPGTVRGLTMAHQKFGTMPWKDLVEPAVKLAADGFLVDDALAKSLNGVLKNSPEFAELQRVFAPPEGKPQWQAGDLLRQPELAKTLQQIADHGADGFYLGTVADLLVAEMKAGNGIMTKADLSAYEAKIRAPIHGTYRGFDIFGPPPPSSGGICLVMMLNMLEPHQLTALPSEAHASPRWSANTMHLVIESMRRAYRQRAEFLGDGDVVKIPQKLTTKAYALELSQNIDLKRATPSEQLAGDIPLVDESESTTHFSIVDGNGMAVSNTYTLEHSFGSRIVVRGAGFLLNNEMGDFNRVPGHTDRNGLIGTKPNLAEPRKRMLSSQCPTLVLKDGRLAFVTGSPGGRTIINTVLCNLINTIDFQMTVRQAIDSPRMHHQWFPDVVRFEGIGHKDYADQLKELQTRGHHLAPSAHRQGDAHSISIEASNQQRVGAADQRLDGKAGGF